MENQEMKTEQDLHKTKINLSSYRVKEGTTFQLSKHLTFQKALIVFHSDFFLILGAHSR